MEKSPTAIWKTMRFLVFREGMFPSVSALVNAVVNEKVINDTKAMVAELKAGVTKWAKETETGKTAYEYAGSSMNIGDLANEDMEPILANCPNIFKIDFEQLDAADDWMYDTSLCEEISTEA